MYCLLLTTAGRSSLRAFGSAIGAFQLDPLNAITVAAPVVSIATPQSVPQ